VLRRISAVDVLKVYVSIQIPHWTSSWRVMSYWVLSDKITVINLVIANACLIVVPILIEGDKRSRSTSFITGKR